MNNNATSGFADTNIAFWTADKLWGEADNGRIIHGVSRRIGGVSAVPYASLNLGLHVGDDAEAVRENRRRAAAAMGFEIRQMVCGAQIHGAQVAIVTAQDAGRGALVYEDALPNVDALVTDAPGVLLALFFADCLPIFFADAVRGVVGVAHAGWRGLDAGVIKNTIATMQTAYGTTPGDLWAAVGPGIGPVHFEVGDEVATRFPDEILRLLGDQAKPHVDLPKVAVRCLLKAGVSPARLSVSEDCTANSPDRYFSHRRDGARTGRMGAFIGVRR